MVPLQPMRRALAVFVVVGAAAAVAVVGAGEALTAPARRDVGPPPPALHAVPVVIEGADDGAIRGWFARGTPGAGAVLLLHGLRADRRQMVGRARFLHAAGYSVLLVDLPAHGESDGARITFGHRESAGVRAAMRFLAEAVPDERTAVIGVSLGAAAFVLADVRPPPAAVVLESMYPTIDEAAANRLRLRLGSAGAWLAPVLVRSLSARLRIAALDLRPIDRVAALRAPLLVVAGTHDRHTSVGETRRLYDAAAAPKTLWLVEGAGHVDLHAFGPAAYEANVAAFLARHLRDRAASPSTRRVP